MLTEVVPPCTPAPGSTVDPCAGGGIGVEGGTRGSYALPLPPDGPRPYLFATGELLYHTVHIVARATFLPGTVRCTAGNTFQVPSHLAGSELGDRLSIDCYAGVRVNEYIVGNGPTNLTVMIDSTLYYEGQYTADELEHERTYTEAAYVFGGEQPPWVSFDYGRVATGPEGGIVGRESVLFLGPSGDSSTQVWRAYAQWPVQRIDGNVVAVHPYRDLYTEAEQTRWKSRLEVRLNSFKTAVQSAHRTRVSQFGGRVARDVSSPMLVTNASQLEPYFRAVGSYHNNAVPDQPPDIPCRIQLGMLLNDVSLAGLWTGSGRRVGAPPGECKGFG